jgi:hypothetical protein
VTSWCAKTPPYIEWRQFSDEIVVYNPALARTFLLSPDASVLFGWLASVGHPVTLSELQMELLEPTADDDAPLLDVLLHLESIGLVDQITP